VKKFNLLLLSLRSGQEDKSDKDKRAGGKGIEKQFRKLTLMEKMPSKLVNLSDVSELLLKFIPVTREQLRMTFNVPDVLMTVGQEKDKKKTHALDNETWTFGA